MKVLLVQPPTHSGLGLQTFMVPEPLGLEVIAGSLRAEHEVHVLDMRLEPALRRKLASFRPDAVGVSSCFSPDVYNTFRVLEIVKEHNPRIFTFVGGQHATMAHADFMGHADAVVLGEGELTALELLGCWEQGRPLDEVSGLAFRRDSSWIETAPRCLMDDLDEAPLPARSLVSKYLAHYVVGSGHPIALVETSRGCPHRCKFCSVWRFFRHSFRSRSPQRVVEELRQVECEAVLFTDDSALSEPARSESIIEKIERAGLRKRYAMQIRADAVVNARDILARWRDIGLDGVFVGFESISQRALDEYGKRLAAACFEEAIDTLRNLGITFTGSFIVSPDFAKEDFAALRRFVKRMKLSKPAFSVLTPLPGTALYDERWEDVTSENYELYDLLHSVLPTRLGLKEFYRQFVRLYFSSYYNYLGPAGLARSLSEGQLGSFLSRFVKGLGMLKDNHPWAMVRHHQLPPGKLSEEGFPKEARWLHARGR